MLLNIPDNFPALQLLAKEKLTVSNSSSSNAVTRTPLKVAVLNLMPLKITTEADILRILGYSPLSIYIDFIYLESHTSKNTPLEHITEFYKSFSSVNKSYYDGLIVTGAPVELIPFEEVNYWKELMDVFAWARIHVKSSMYICWGAQAALYTFNGVPKYGLDKKLFGIYSHTVNNPSHALLRGFDDTFYAPHSRHTTISKKDIQNHPELTILSESAEAGIYIIANDSRKEFYITGHSEYAPLALHNEYERDMKKGLSTVDIPINYYPLNDPNQQPMVQWRSHANLLFTNWLHEFVATPL